MTLSNRDTRSYTPNGLADLLALADMSVRRFALALNVSQVTVREWLREGTPDDATLRERIDAVTDAESLAGEWWWGTTEQGEGEGVLVHVESGRAVPLTFRGPR